MAILLASNVEKLFIASMGNIFARSATRKLNLNLLPDGAIKKGGRYV
jgi:hypothetical protein